MRTGRLAMLGSYAGVRFSSWEPRRSRRHLESGTKYALIGGLAVQLWGEEARTTLDIDVAVSGYEEIPRLTLEAAMPRVCSSGTPTSSASCPRPRKRFFAARSEPQPASCESGPAEGP